MRYITVRELIETLQQIDQNRIVVQSIDEEGNGFVPFSGDLSLMNYENGDVFYTMLTEELKAQGYTDEDIFQGGTPAVVLWP